MRTRLLSTVPEEQLREDQSGLANWTRGDRRARFEQTAERHAGLSQFAAPFLSRMKFVDEQGEGTSPTLAALRAYREHRSRSALPVNGQVLIGRWAYDAAVDASTVTMNCCVATELSAPLAVTVMVVTPAATGVTVTSDPVTPTVATLGADDNAW